MVADSDAEMLCLRVAKIERVCMWGGETGVQIGMEEPVPFLLAPSPADKSSKTRQWEVKSHGVVGR